MDTALTYPLPRMGHIKHIHFVGIGGAGMCGIAEVLSKEGYHVTGSDLAPNKATQYLESLGISVSIGHDAALVKDADVLVTSTAIDHANPERLAAREKGIPIIPRAAMLAELMRYRFGIAIAGTHGKTTTTSLVCSILDSAGLDPSYVIGGKLNCSGHNAQLGHSAYFVAEADESDASFLFLKPTMAVITNIDADHMSTYNNDFEKLKSTFIEFLHHLPFYGLAVLCVDDPHVQAILPAVERKVLTYGFSKAAQYQVTHWEQNGLVSTFSINRPAPHQPLTITLPSPGEHNVLNALAAIAIATELDISDDAIVRGLGSFQGVGRRFQVLGEVEFSSGRALVIDDYGHHPKEIAATLGALRKAWPNRPLIHVFQPHRYSRTKELFSDFIDVLSSSDTLLLLDIYSAGETPIEGINSQALLEKLSAHVGHARLVTAETLASTLDELSTDGGVILMQGAGNVSQLAQHIAQFKSEKACD